MPTERPYSKRELDQKFKSFEEKNDAWNASIMQKLDALDKDKLEPLLVQAKLTNGRVNRHEGVIRYMNGALAVVVLVVLPALAFLTSQIIRNSEATSTIQGQVEILIKNLNRSNIPNP